jgi:PIN domain nuclease of toxin-antitoxin system
VWALSTPELLSKSAKRALNNGDILVSVVNLWELILKKERANALLTDPVRWWMEYVSQRFTCLPINFGHVLEVNKLVHHHHDPFDRMLLAQCRCEGLTLVTKDKFLSKYDVPTFW